MWLPISSCTGEIDWKKWVNLECIFVEATTMSFAGSISTVAIYSGIFLESERYGVRAQLTFLTNSLDVTEKAVASHAADN